VEKTKNISNWVVVYLFYKLSRYLCGEVAQEYIYFFNCSLSLDPAKQKCSFSQENSLLRPEKVSENKK